MSVTKQRLEISSMERCLVVIMKHISGVSINSYNLSALHLFESYFGGPPNSFDLQRQLQMGPRLSTYSQKTAKPMQEKGKRIIINLKQRKLKIELVQKILNQEKI